ncbi:hypothetical protein K502DRAFT_348155 [Neoconidiobolus thromboides FSU 785]|nr:hypothetical protein K502DRAFT_348155 [Neoconidiobolus thromboides FSU 785]
MHNDTPKKLLGETILTVQDKVAVYYDDEKKPSIDSVTLYITSHQIYFKKDNSEINFHLKNQHIISFQNITGNIFKSHKIKIIYIEEVNEVVEKWTCDFCLFKENEIKNNICISCNLSRSSRTDSKTNSKTAKQKDTTGIVCQGCTFINHPLMKFCEICELKLDNDEKENEDHNKKDEPIAKVIVFSFRGGGQPIALSSLESSLNKKAWKAKYDEGSFIKNEELTYHGGISSITQRAEKSKITTQETLTQAFSDIDALMERATHMAKLAEYIVNKLKAKNISDNSEAEMVESYFQKLGIESPISKDVAGSLFYLEIANEVGQVILPIITNPPYIGVMDVIDVYCIFNKARGIGNLVSPSDLVASFNKFDEARVPLIFDTFSTGVKVIKHKDSNDDIIVDKIVNILDTKQKELDEYFGLDSTAIANNLGGGMSLEIINHYLKQAEIQGKLCRDLVPPLNIITYYLPFPFFEE